MSWVPKFGAARLWTLPGEPGKIHNFGVHQRLQRRTQTHGLGTGGAVSPSWPWKVRAKGPTICESLDFRQVGLHFGFRAQQDPVVCCARPGLLQSIAAQTSQVFPFLVGCLGCKIRISRTIRLRYKEVITKRRILTAACCFWVIGLAATSLYFIHRSVFGAIVIVSELVSIVVTSVAYLKIYKIVRRHAREIESQRRVSVDPNAQIGLNMKKYQRSTFTMVIVFMLSFVCYVPYSAVMVAKLKYGFTANVKVAIDIFSTVICINSSLNPLIYCWRMKEVKQAVWAVVKRNTAVTPGLNNQSMMTFAPIPPQLRYAAGSKTVRNGESRK